MISILQTRKAKKTISYLIWLVLCLLFLTIFIGPFFWMIFTSFKPRNEIFAFPPQILPQRWVVSNYVRMWQEMNWLKMFFNSIWINALSVALIVFISSIAAFAFSKLRFPFREPLFLLVIAGMIVPEQVDLIPRFLMMVRWNLVGTYIPVVLLIAGQGFQTFMLRQFIMTIPDTYIEAAKLDGMGYFSIYWKIILPLAKSGLLTMVIYSMFMVWNQYLYPLVYLTKPNMFTVQVGLGVLRDRLLGQYGPIMAASTLVCLPTLIVYFIFQRNFTTGIAMSGIKG